MALVITNIGSLVTNDESLGLGLLALVDNAAIVIDEGKVAWVGPNAQAPAADLSIDAAGKAVIPGFVDSHAHLLFAGDRAREFEARMNGQNYSAGGIHSTVAATRAATNQQLEHTMLALATEMTRSGITTFETKSGYGLTTHDETRALALASQHTQETTFLGAHVIPKEYAQDPDGYVSLIVDEMIDAVSPHSKWIDVFCDIGAFDGDQAREILRAGQARGLHPRIHANQLAHGPGIALAVELDCASADHCSHLEDSDIAALAGSNTVATLLPGAEFSTRAAYPDSRRLWEAGVTVAIATDCNPGSSYTTSMPFCMAIAIRDMHFSPEQALWSATMGGAKALRRDDVGHLSLGASADLTIVNAPSFLHLGYRPGVGLIDTVIKNGTTIYKGIA
jgi:imidazolonepropionase